MARMLLVAAILVVTGCCYQRINVRAKVTTIAPTPVQAELAIDLLKSKAVCEGPAATLRFPTFYEVSP